MKKNLLSLILFLCVNLSFAQSTSKIEKAIIQLKLAMINADSILLYKLTDANLSYGHSSGLVEDKQAFINKIVTGKSDFVTINLTEQTITATKKTAVVRHILHATTNDNGKPNEVHLKVLLVWHKTHGQWKLLARQAVKI
jgi:hypothetical protein